jgi:hypothetical protein
MRHLKLFENVNSIASIKDTIKKYHEILEYVKPVVIQRYNEIANDPDMDYGQNITDVYGGDSFYVIHNIKDIKLTEMKIHDNKIFFTLEYQDNYENDVSTFFVPFTDEELENSLIKNKANKYNL